MSHVVTIQTRVTDTQAVEVACHRLELPAPTHGTTRLFQTEVTGLLVQLPGWRYPLVIDTAGGQVQFDHYNGRWGEPKHLDRFLQLYAVEKTRLKARKKGYAIVEQSQADGSVLLCIKEGS